jgi:2-polyprenyl-3-methyl-5-hydroxy-6-metoxy-1,4-benzoquinol methylase
MIQRFSCPACNATAAPPLLTIPYQQSDLQGYLHRIGFGLPAEWFLETPFAVHLCPDCETLFQGWVLEESQLAKLYGQNSAEHRAPSDSSLLSLAHLAHDAMLLRRLIPVSKPRVLDYGMGWGRFALLAQAFGCEVTGVEASDTTREHAQRHGIRVCEEGALESAEYDFVLVDQVLEHLSDPAATLTRLAQCLKPGGLLLAGVPGHPQLGNRLARAARESKYLRDLTDRDWKALCPTIHVNLFNARSLRAMGKRAGLNGFRPPFWRAVGIGSMWDQARQWNHNFRLASKYSRGTGTRLWFQRPH